MTQNSATPPRKSDAREAQARAFLLASDDPATRAQAAAWRAADPANDTAYRAAERAWGLLGQLGPSAEAVIAGLPRRRPRGPGPWTLAAGSAAAASLAVLILGGAWLALPPGGAAALFANARTAPGRPSEVVLPDGTRVALNGGSALNWRVTPTGRHAELVSGEAEFVVAHDPARPFTLAAGPAQITDLGTRFDVARFGPDVMLTLAEGSVRTTDAEGGSAQDLVPGQARRWVGGRAEPALAADAAEAEAWRRGRLIVRARPLSEVAQALERAGAGKVLVLGERAQALSVTGVFDTNRSDLALAALGKTLPVTVRSLPGVTVIY
jgi:transmembrane sensor